LRPLDLGARPMLRAGPKWALIGSEAFDRRLLERLHPAGHRIAVVELVEGLSSQNCRALCRAPGLNAHG
jgi:hypothetical protein